MTVTQMQQRIFDSGLEAAIPSTSQTELIRLIQLRSGHEPCYLSDKRYFCTEKCEWSEECRKLRAKWSR